MEAFVDKLINVTRHHAEQIADQWSAAIRSNHRTASYKAISHEACKKQAVDFYKNLRSIYYSDQPYEESIAFFTRFAEDRHREGIPLSEAVYAIIMMRRHLWLFADFQEPFLKGLDVKQKVGTINRTIRIFDHGIYTIITTYHDLEGRG